MWDTLRQILTSPELHRGLLPAGVVLVLGVVAAPFAGRRPPLPVGGLAFGAAGVVALWDSPLVTSRSLVGLAVVGVAGLVVGLAPGGSILGALVALPAAWLVVGSVPADLPLWAMWAGGAVLVAAVPLVARLDAALEEPPLGPVLLTVTVAAAFTTVPDTEEILPLLPIALAVGLIAWPLRAASLGNAGSALSLGLVVAVILFDGRGRLTAIVGGLGTLTLPLLAGLWATVRSAGTLPRPTVLAAIHLAAAFAAARVAGLYREPAASLLALGLTVVGTALLLAVTRARSAPPGSHPPPGPGRRE